MACYSLDYLVDSYTPFGSSGSAVVRLVVQMFERSWNFFPGMGWNFLQWASVLASKYFTDPGSC